MPRLTVKQIKDKVAKLKGSRQVWDSHWQEVADYMNPRKNTITNEKSQGQKRTFQLLDNTAMHCNELLAGMLHSVLTNPDVYWHEYTTGNLELDSNDEVRKYLQQAMRVVHNVLNNSNFQTEVAELYIDLPSIGTACQYIEEDEDDVVRFSTKFIKDYYICEDRHGRVAEIYREWKWKVAEIVAEFGEKALPEKYLKDYKAGKDTEVLVMHAVYPKYLGGDKPGKIGKKFYSQYILPDCDHELRNGEYTDFPYVVPRWAKAAGETYGRSPGMTALPEIKVLNKMNETMLIGAQKLVDPPIQMPDDGFIMPIVTKPGGINYYRAGTQELIKPIFNDTRMDFGYQAMEDRRKRIRDAYFVDQLKLQQGGPMMTATEVLQRTEESTRLLGPVLGRMQNEYLAPMIDIVFRICQERKLLPQAPEALRNVTLKVRYSSLIAKSQRVSEAQNIQRTIQAAAPFIQLDPSVADNFSGDNAVKVLANVFGLPQEILRDVKQRDAMRTQRAEAQAAAAQAAAQAQQVAESGQVVDTMSKISQVQTV